MLFTRKKSKMTKAKDMKYRNRHIMRTEQEFTCMNTNFPFTFTGL